MSKPVKSDATTNIQELRDAVAAFQAERGWEKHHTPKNVAISLCLEAAELLEHFQWDETYTRNDKQAIADELADVIFNCFNFANQMDIDITSAFLQKLERTKKKYPVEIFNGNQDNPEEYFRIKKAYRDKPEEQS